MALILPKGKYDFDLYPLTEELVEISDDGRDVRKEVFIDGVIEIPDEDVRRIRVSKCFSDDLEALVDMTPEEVAEEEFRRMQADAPGALVMLHAALGALDYLTNKRIEGELADDEWQRVIDQRNDLRRQIRRLESSSGS